MAHNAEPMDIDNIESDFDNKENSIHHSNVYPRTPCTEKGYEELDVSELNMKLRYSITPASSPMSKSFTANCNDNKSLESGDDNLNSNLTRSLHSAIPKGDVVGKSVKQLPLQSISSEQFVDSNRNAAVLRPLDMTAVIGSNVTVTVSGSTDVDENISFPSSSSSTAQTPEATTPTKDIPRNDGGSPIMRGLKSVLNMFRSSQSPIPPEGSDGATKKVLSPADVTEVTPNSSLQATAVLASTPIAANKHRDSNLSKRSSPLKESLVFNEDLEKELLWKDETTILFSQEKIPIHKLFFQQGTSSMKEAKNTEVDTDLNSTVEYMDVSYNDSMIKNRTITDLQGEAVNANDSDTEFVDCETTFTNDKMEADQTGPVDSACNESKQATVSDIISAVTVDNTNTNTKAEVSVELPTVNDEKEDIGIPEVKSKPELKYSEQESIIDNTINILSHIEIESDKVKTSVNMESVIEANNKSELDLPLGITFDTSKLLADVDIAKDIQPDHNEPQLVMTKIKEIPVNLETTPLPDIVEITKNSEKSETCTDTVPHSIVPNTEIENVKLDIKNANVTVEDEAKVVPKESLEEFVLPAIIPLPDDDDMENEKSIGAALLVKEECADPISLEINNRTAMGVENVDPVENMPTVPANSTDVYNVINDCDAIKDITAVNSHNKLNEDELLNGNKIESNENFVDHSPVQEEINPIEMLTISEPMDINDSISEIHVRGEVLQQNTANINHNEANLGNILELVKDKTNQLDSQTVHETPTDANGDKKEGSEMHVNEIPHLPDTVDYCAIKEDIQPVNETEIEENVTINQFLPMPDIVNNAVSPDEELSVSQSHTEEYKATSVINNVVQQIPVAKEENDNNLDNVVKPIKLDEIEAKISSREDIETVGAIIEPTIDVSVLSNSENVMTVCIAPEIACLKEELILKDVNVINNNVQDLPCKDEEIVVSANNSPYVSLAGEIEQLNFEEVETPLATKTKELLTPPSSPKIVSKGYNFNFDEIDDPFATKTKIRLSPTPDTPDRPIKNTDTAFAERPPQRDVNKNRRKSQPERKKLMPKKKMNSTFSGSVNIQKNISNTSPKVIEHKSIEDRDIQSNISPEVIEHKAIEDRDIQSNISPEVIEHKAIEDRDIQDQILQVHEQMQDKSLESKLLSPEDFGTMVNSVNKMENLPEMMPQELTNQDLPKEQKSVDVRDIDTAIEAYTEENKTSVESLNAISNEIKNTSSSEQSIYYSAGTSSSEGSKNVFNLPEIDDMNFNPFVTKSKMRQSPPPSLNASASLNTTQELPSSSDATKSDDTFTKNPFETKSKMRLSPPPNLNKEISLNATQNLAISSETPLKPDATFTEDPFETKSKMRMSPPPALNATQDIPCSSNTTRKLQSDATFTEVHSGDHGLNKDYETKAIDPFDDKEYANLSNTTCSSKATDEKDLTVREVHTEDEDTVEGPFLEADSDNDDKMSDFDGEDVDMMQFSEIPPQIAEDNADGGELFIDAEAFEFLLNQNKSNVVTDSGKESLFLKFDPLFAKRMSSDGVLAALNKKRQSTPKKMSAQIQMDATFDKSIAGPSVIDTTHEVATSSTSLAEESTEDFNITVSKPTMVVTPAVNPIVTPRNRATTPLSSNRRSITFTSPAIAVIDRLLSLSANNSLVGHDTTVTHMSREQNEADLALTQLRELLAEKEINVYNLRTESKELKDRLSSMESQMRILESESESRLKKINDLNEKLTEKTKLNKSMAAVVEEYERTIASLIAETEQDKKRNNEERIRLIKERDEQTAHLASMEVSFSDLHSKYEKSKQIILTCKANEDTYKKSIKEFEENLTKMQSNYELLKQHATSKLNHANQELEKMNRSHEAEVLKLNAMIKRKDLHITSLEETLAQKTKANEELTAICDELINKVG